jgi:hypothetical protein
MRPGRLLIPLAIALALLGGPAPAGAAAGLERCALGQVAPALRTLVPTAIDRERRAYEARLRPAERAAGGRAFTTALAAYVYGMPAVLLRRTVDRYPRNALLGIGELATPALRSVVAPNHDTLYSVSKLDLTAGPLVVDAPATGGRYSVLQLLDAYSNAFAYVGSGAERDADRTVLIVPPGWRGTPPAGARVVRSPTNLVWLLGRTLIDGAADAPAATALMARYALTPLDAWTGGERARMQVLPQFPRNQNEIVLPRGTAFFDALGERLAADPPPARDACALRAFAAAGIGPGRQPSRSATAAQRRAMAAAVPAGERVVRRALFATRDDSRRRHNRWSYVTGNIGRFGTDYVRRAVVASAAFAANVPSEAVYPNTDIDADGRPLTGRRRYVVTFPPGGLPPVRSFWSMTLYGGDLFLVPNPLRRYAVGDRTPGLRREPDGSLRIYLQHDPPPARLRSNWLPTPKGAFLLYLRLYEPKAAAARARWTPPTVRAR